jgi:hypothetical protein
MPVKTSKREATQRKTRRGREGKAAPAVAVAVAVALPALERHLTVDQCAAISGESKWTWRDRAYRQVVSSVKIGGQYSRLLIPESEVRRLLFQHTRPAVVA